MNQLIHSRLIAPPAVRVGARRGVTWPASVLTLVLTVLTAFAGNVMAQVDASDQAEPRHVAPVRIDGVVLFSLRGASALSAETRARQVRDRIRTVARDPAFDPADINVLVEPDRHIIRAGDFTLVQLIEADAQLEEVPLPILSEIVQAQVVASLVKYRADRSPDALKVSALYFVGLSLALAALVWLLGVVRRVLDRQLQTRVAAQLKMLERKSMRMLNSGQLWNLSQGLVKLLYALALLVVAYFYLNSVLGAFPYTRGYALWLLDMITGPLSSMGQGLLSAIPDLIFLLILFLIVRYVLRTMGLFFRAVHRGNLKLENFDPEWAMPTFRITRVVVIAFALVVAYPYIPGSDSAAFKGVSLFLGVMVSLGSTSFIANMIAGLTMTYRGAYRIGDWVRIGDEEGQVEEMGNMVMRLRTRLNESVTIPNSVILNSNVTNFSQWQTTPGLVLHTVVGIGYDTPWRQVESMLLEAAGRTEGVLTEPEPWVLQKQLGDFAVSYGLNVYVNDAAKMPLYYSELHRNIQDVFNEQRVQIMSPAYMADPAEPKIAPLTPPAKQG